MPKKEKTYRALVNGNVDAHGKIEAYELKAGEVVKPCVCHVEDMLRDGQIEEQGQARG